MWELGLVPGMAPTSLPAPLGSTTGARATFHPSTLGQRPERRGGETEEPWGVQGSSPSPQAHSQPWLSCQPQGTQPPETPELHSSRMSPLTAWKLQGVWPGAKARRRKLWAVAVASPLGGGVSAPGASLLQLSHKPGRRGTVATGRPSRPRSVGTFLRPDVGRARRRLALPDLGRLPEPGHPQGHGMRPFLSPGEPAPPGLSSEPPCFRPAGHWPGPPTHATQSEQQGARGPGRWVVRGPRLPKVAAQPAAPVREVFAGSTWGTEAP